MLTQAVVAAGGKGTRLGELARKSGNKSLVEINGVPMISRTVRSLLDLGIEEILIASNYVTEQNRLRSILGGIKEVSFFLIMVEQQV